MTEEDKLYADELRNRALADYARHNLAIDELERQLRNCKTCKHSNNGNCAYTEKCHECMWDSKYEQQPCEDCISRADVKKYLSAPDANGDRVIYESDLDLLPSVTPDVLDKIRERISLEKIGYPPSAGYYKAIVKVLQIIDQYKAESEEEE